MSEMIVDSELLRKQATYIAATDKVLEHNAKQSEAVEAAAPKVAELLVSRGLLSEHRKAAKVKELVDNPSAMLDVITKLGELSAPRATIGSPSEPVEKSASMQSADDTFATRILS